MADKKISEFPTFDGDQGPKTYYIISSGDPGQADSANYRMPFTNLADDVLLSNADLISGKTGAFDLTTGVSGSFTDKLLVSGVEVLTGFSFPGAGGEVIDADEENVNFGATEEGDDRAVNFQQGGETRLEINEDGEVVVSDSFRVGGTEGGSFTTGPSTTSVFEGPVTNNSSTNLLGATNLAGPTNIAGATQIVAPTFDIGEDVVTTISGSTFLEGATTIKNTLTVADGKATTLGGTLDVAAGKATTLGGSLTVADGQTTTLGGSLYIDSDSEVGIGTDIPSRTLDIVDATNDGSGGLKVQNYKPVIELSDSTANATATTLTQDNTKFTIANDSVDSLTIDSDGNVGIGTDSPQHILDVRSSEDLTTFVGNQTPGVGIKNKNTAVDNVALLAFKGSEANTVLAGVGMINRVVSPTAGVSVGDLAFYSKPAGVSNLNDSPSMLIDSDGKVGIGTDIPDAPLHIVGSPASTLILERDSADVTAISSVVLKDGSDDQVRISSTDSKLRLETGSGNDLRMLIDSDGNVGIDTDDPTDKLYIKAGFNDSGATIENTSANPARLTLINSEGSGYVDCNNNLLRLSNNTSSDLVIDSDGNVGIGTDSPSKSLEVRLTDDTAYTDGVTSNSLKLRNLSQSADSYSGIELTAGQTSGGGANIARIYGVKESTTTTATSLAFTTRRSDESLNERMRIDSNGNVGIGTDSPSSKLTIGFDDNGTDGISFRSSSNANLAKILASNETSSQNGNLQFHTRLLGTSVERMRIDSSGNVTPGTDDAQDFGSTSKRWDDIYATNATIQTSDRELKQDIEELTEAETRVAQACKGLLRKYRWKSSVEEKGDDARIHFGIMAQDLEAAFAAEGLDAGRYGMFIKNTWWEADRVVPAVEAVEAVEAQPERTERDIFDNIEDAPEGATEVTQRGVRYAELLAFIIAAI